MSAIKEHLAHYLERRAAGDTPALALYRARCESAARQNLHEVYWHRSGQYILEGIEGVPDGYRLTLTVHDDTISSPDDADCFDREDAEAWREGRWRYVGIEVAVVDDDGTERDIPEMTGAFIIHLPEAGGYSAVPLRTGDAAALSPDNQALLRLRKRHDVLLTPHNAFNTIEAVERKSEQSIRTLLQFRKTGQFLWPVPEE